MKKTILIIEDNSEQLNWLKQLVISADENVAIYAVQSAEQAYSILMERTIDIFMVDIILNVNDPGDMSGMQIVEKLRSIPKYMFTPVLFITALEDPTMYAYTNLNCLGYIEKPFEPEKVLKLLKKALCYTTNRGEDVFLSFRKDGLVYPVDVKKIVYMETNNHVMSIHVSDGECLEIPYITCKQILNKTDTDCLIQCSRNTLVNKNYVSGIDVANRYIILKDDFGVIGIGVTYRKRISAEFGNRI